MLGLGLVLGLGLGLGLGFRVRVRVTCHRSLSPRERRKYFIIIQSGRHH